MCMKCHVLYFAFIYFTIYVNLCADIDLITIIMNDFMLGLHAYKLGWKFNYLGCGSFAFVFIFFTTSQGKIQLGIRVIVNMST